MSRSAGASMARGAALSFARLGSGLVRVKFVALALGVSGVGIYSLVQQVNMTAMGLVSWSLAVPIINLGRPLVAGGRAAEAGRIAGTALAMVALNSLVLLIVAALFGASFFGWIGAGMLDPMLIWPVVLASIIGAFASSFWEGLSFLSDRFDAYVKVGIASTLADMVFIAAGAWFYGLRGAIIALPAGSIVSFAAYALYLARDPVGKAVLHNLSVSVAQLPRLLTYSAMMFGAIALTNIGLTAARTKVLLDAGPAANGELQVVTSLAAYTLAFVTTGFWGHMHARAAAAGDTDEVRAHLDQALRLALLISFTGCGLAMVLADYLVPLFYSPRFTGAVPLMIAYMPGELCYQLLTLLTAYQLTISRRRRYLIWSLGYVGLLVAIAAVAIPRFGPGGYVVAHVAAAATMLGLSGWICWRTGQITTRFVLFGAGLVALLALMSGGIFVVHGQSKVWVLAALIPVLVTGTIALRLLAHGVLLRRQ